METRKVTIINSKTQSQKVIQDSRATTLGELKQEMMDRGIDYSGMTFYEGHMRAELKDDAAPLPTNIPYKGQVVNDLVFMLTAPDKKVKSGVMSRTEAYAEIKKRGLQDICKTKFGKNFTQCSTSDLLSLIKHDVVADETKHVEEKNPVKKEEPVTSVKEEKDVTSTDANIGCNCHRALIVLVQALYEDDIINVDTQDSVMACLNGDTYKKPERMSKKEIDDMFGFIS